MGPWRLFNQIQAVWGRAWQGCTLLWTAEVAGSSPTGDRPQVPSPDHRARVPRTQTRLTLPPRPTLPWRGHGEARVSPRAAWPPRRAIFRFNRGYVDLLPRTAFSKTAGQAGRASSAGPPPPTFPGCTNFQGVLFLEQWSQLLPRPGQAHWLQNSAEPLPRQTPWQLGLQPGEPRGPAARIPRWVATA